MRLNRQRLHDSLHHNLLILYTISLPYFLHIGNYVLALLLINWLIEGNLKSKLNILAASTPAKFIFVLFALFLIGLLYSSNITEALGDIERKLSLLILPAIILSRRPLSSLAFSKIQLYFAISCVIATTIALIVALVKYGYSGDSSLLFYHQLSSNIGMHAVYLSCYLCFSIFVFIDFLRNEKFSIRSLAGAGIVILLLYILFLMILLASKTILVSFAFVLSIYFFFLSNHHNLKRSTLLILSINFILITIILITPYTRNRFENLVSSNFEVLQQEQFRHDTEFTGLSLRLLFWKLTTEILTEERAWVFGVGTGDSQERLAAIYKKYNLYLGNGKEDVGYLNYNTHSLYFEVLLKLGLIGLLYLLALLAYIIYQSFKKQQPMLLAWVLIFILFSITESTLQTNKGIIYFAFLYSVFLSKHETYKDSPLDAKVLSSQ